MGPNVSFSSLNSAKTVVDMDLEEDEEERQRKYLQRAGVVRFFRASNRKREDAMADASAAASPFLSSLSSLKQGTRPMRKKKKKKKKTA